MGDVIAAFTAGIVAGLAAAVAVGAWFNRRERARADAIAEMFLSELDAELSDTNPPSVRQSQSPGWMADSRRIH